MGEWFALPLLKHAGSKKIGDAVFDEIFHPIARELIGKCDAVLRIGGPSSGADDMVETGQKLDKTIFRDMSEIPIRAREQPRRHRLDCKPGGHARAASPRCRRSAGSSMRRGNACVRAVGVARFEEHQTADASLDDLGKGARARHDDRPAVGTGLGHG